MNAVKRLRLPLLLALVVAGASLAVVANTGLGQTSPERISKKGKVAPPKGKSRSRSKLFYGFVKNGDSIAAGKAVVFEVGCPKTHPYPLGGQFDTPSSDVVLIGTFNASRTSWKVVVKNQGSTEAKWFPGVVCSK